MSQENVERLRQAYDAFNATRQVDLNLMAPDVEFIQPDQLGGGEGVYHGPDGFARGVQELLDTFDDFHVEPEKYFDLGSQVVAFVRLQGRARGSGVPIDAPFAHVVTFRGSKVVAWRAYEHRAEALEAVGLSE
jgi:ketosteroid isomerase-like protein